MRRFGRVLAMLSVAGVVVWGFMDQTSEPRQLPADPTSEAAPAIPLPSPDAAQPNAPQGPGQADLRAGPQPPAESSKGAQAKAETASADAHPTPEELEEQNRRFLWASNLMFGPFTLEGDTPWSSSGGAPNAAGSGGLFPSSGMWSGMPFVAGPSAGHTSAGSPSGSQSTGAPQGGGGSAPPANASGDAPPPSGGSQGGASSDPPSGGSPEPPSGGSADPPAGGSAPPGGAGNGNPSGGSPSNGPGSTPPSGGTNSSSPSYSPGDSHSSNGSVDLRLTVDGLSLLDPDIPTGHDSPAESFFFDVNGNLQIASALTQEPPLLVDGTPLGDNGDVNALPVPEPSTLVLTASATLGYRLLQRRRQRRGIRHAEAR